MLRLGTVYIITIIKLTRLKMIYLLYYHFACITIFTENDFDLWSLGEISIPNNILNHIYTPYLERIQFVLKQLKDKFNKDTKQFLSKKI